MSVASGGTLDWVPTHPGFLGLQVRPAVRWSFLSMSTLPKEFLDVFTLLEPLC